MGPLKRMLAAGSLCLAFFAHAGDEENRVDLSADFATAFARSDFALIESRYAHALATQERMKTGHFVSNRMVHFMFYRLDKNDPNWDAAEERTRSWAAQYPKSVVPALALNRIYEKRAWMHRGNGYASTVTEEGWKLFFASMKQANEALLSRAEIGKNDPNWWFEMLSRAQAQSWPNDRYWLLANDALTAFPQNEDIYRAIAMRLVPQWGGSWQALAAFADGAVARTRETQGQIMYARIYWNVSGYFDDSFLTRVEGNWPKFRAGLEDLLARYPDRWNLNGFARFACAAGDKDTTRRLLAQINDAAFPAAWPSQAIYYRCRNWAAS
jgi:hypothetical protein